MCEFFREKYQIVVLSTFDQRESKKKNILTKKSTVCEKGYFLPFFAHCTYFRQNIYFFKFMLIKSSQKKNLNFSLKNSHIFLKILISDCKVFKLERFSSVIRDVSGKNPI